MSHHHHHHHHHHDRHAVIRNASSGLVLDASEYEVKLHHFNGSHAQLWQLEEAGPGKFYFINKHTGHALDIQSSAKSGHNLITYAKHGGENQQWYVNSDDTIVSAAEGDLAVDVCRGHLSSGAHLIAYKRHGGANQRFLIEYQ